MHFIIGLLMLTMVAGCQETSHVKMVVNPYDQINWQKADQHKANLHTHTTASDGRLSPQRTIDEYHRRGYSILSLTDHNQSTYPWTVLEQMEPSTLSRQRYDEGIIDRLDDFENRDPNVMGMLAIAGNELSRHHHTLSLFSDYETSQRDLSKVLEEQAAYSDWALAVLAHPAMHWPAQFGPETSVRVALEPAIRKITMGDFTIEAWFRTTDSGRNIIMGNYSGDYSGSLNLELHTNNRLRVYVQPAGQGTTVNLMVTAQRETREGGWHHIAGVRRGEEVFVYLDGEQAGRANDTAGNYELQGEVFHIGQDTRGGGRSFEGELDHIRLWSRGLTSDEVALIATGRVPGEGIAQDALLVQYTFEDLDGLGAGEKIQDSAGHPEGPFHAMGGDEITPAYREQVAAPLEEAGVSSRTLEIKPVLPTRVTEAAVAYYAEYFHKFDHLIGLEVHNGTRPLEEYYLDRELWDKLLSEMMPERPVWGLATDDMHQTHHLGRDWVTIPLETLDKESVHQALMGGSFYFSSILVYEGERPDAERTPRIESLEHDEDAGLIRIRATEKGEKLREEAYIWISNGEVVHTGPVIHYHSLETVGSYLRAEIAGSGGTTYTNPFGFSNISTDVR